MKFVWDCSGKGAPFSLIPPQSIPFEVYSDNTKNASSNCYIVKHLNGQQGNNSLRSNTTSEAHPLVLYILPQYFRQRDRSRLETKALVVSSASCPLSSVVLTLLLVEFTLLFSSCILVLLVF